MAAETYHGFMMVRDHFVPHAVATAVGPVGKRLDGVSKARQAGDAASSAQIANVTKNLMGAVEAGDARLAGGIDAGVADVTDALRAGLSNVNKRIGGLTGEIAVGVAAATGVAIIARTLGFARCTNVRRAGKALCRADPRILDSLLVDTLAIFSLIGIVEFARGVQGVQMPVTGLILAGMRETKQVGDEIGDVVGRVIG